MPRFVHTGEFAVEDWNDSNFRRRLIEQFTRDGLRPDEPFSVDTFPDPHSFERIHVQITQERETEDIAAQIARDRYEREQRQRAAIEELYRNAPPLSVESLTQKPKAKSQPALQPQPKKKRWITP